MQRLDLHFVPARDAPNGSYPGKCGHLCLVERGRTFDERELDDMLGPE
jgi:hypothetical protein